MDAFAVDLTPKSGQFLDEGDVEGWEAAGKVKGGGKAYKASAKNSDKVRRRSRY